MRSLPNKTVLNQKFKILAPNIMAEPSNDLLQYAAFINATLANSSSIFKTDFLIDELIANPPESDANVVENENEDFRQAIDTKLGFNETLRRLMIFLRSPSCMNNFSRFIDTFNYLAGPASGQDWSIYLDVLLPLVPRKGFTELDLIDSGAGSSQDGLTIQSFPNSEAIRNIFTKAMVCGRMDRLRYLLQKFAFSGFMRGVLGQIALAQASDPIPVLGALLEGITDESQFLIFKIWSTTADRLFKKDVIEWMWHQPALEKAVEALSPCDLYLLSNTCSVYFQRSLLTLDEECRSDDEDDSSDDDDRDPLAGTYFPGCAPKTDESDNETSESDSSSGDDSE
jgi:hypothetical protein